MTDSISRDIVLDAPVARVWRALSDHREFGAWFRVALEAPFAEGEEARGRSTWPGMEHMIHRMRILRIEPERLLAWEWPPFVPDRGPVPEEPWTRVELRLAPEGAGTRVSVRETGFDALSPELREAARLCNEGGWGAQVRNLARHLGLAEPVAG